MTTLNMLNADCWNAVLNFVPVKDIVRSERVSRQWRDITMQYLLGTHLCLYLCPYDKMIYYIKCRPKCRTIELLRPEQEKHLHWINEVTKKFGSSIIAAHCTDEAVFKIISKTCPNLQHLMFVKVPKNKYKFFKDNTEKCMKLKWISFRDCAKLPDVCVSSFLKNETISELDIYYNDQLNGHCLNNIDLSRLKSLCLQSCFNLDIWQFISAADAMTELTELDLTENNVDILEHIHILLDKLPNLESLALGDYEELDLGDEFVKSINRLGRLKRLGLSNNPNVRDEFLNTLARGGTKLQSLDLSCCDEVSSRGLLTLCRAAGGTLRALCVAYVRAISDDLADCVACCPNLTILDVSGTSVTTRLPAAVAAQARTRSMRIFAMHTPIQKSGHSAQYAGIILDYTMYSSSSFHVEFSRYNWNWI